MGTSSNGLPPFSPSDVKPGTADSFGSGGSGLNPNQGVPSLAAVLYALLLRIGTPVANVAALQAVAAADRQDGMVVITLDTHTFWIFNAADATVADADHVAPTDVGGGAGRWDAVASPSGSGSGQVQRITVDIPLATIQAQTSGTPFNVGAVLPANARLVDEEVNVLTALSGGGETGVAMTLQGGTDAAGSLIASTSVFTGAKAIIATVGSDPYQSRAGQQIKMTLTTTSNPLASLTAGHLSVDLFVSIVP